MEQFTKGPWQFTKCGPADSNGMGICSMWGDYESMDAEIDANAHLIAAAPEMYALLNGIAELSNGDMGNLVDGMLCKFDDIEILLTKARGESCGK